MDEVRCNKCNKLLFKFDGGSYETKCNRCGNMVTNVKKSINYDEINKMMRRNKEVVIRRV